MKSMTFGVMPSKREFHAAWEREMGDRDYPYTLRGEDATAAKKARVPDHGSFSESELYGILKKLRNSFNRGNEEAGYLASSILGTLGFEWV